MTCTTYSEIHFQYSEKHFHTVKNTFNSIALLKRAKGFPIYEALI